MITLYLLDCSPLLDEQELARALPLLDEARRSKTERMRVAEKKAQSAGAGLLLRHLFGDADYIYGANGKPCLANREDLHFNISHSGRYVVCAVSDAEVGIDVETNAALRPAVLRRCFTETEQEWIGDNRERFIRLWTMKEAYMKLIGSGLSLPAIDIELTTPPVDGYDTVNNCWWHFVRWEYPVSLCCQQDEVLQIQTLTIKDLL